jgi:hypothetical protein
MKKLKLLFSKVLEFFNKCKVKEPKQTDLEKPNDNDEFAGTDQAKETNEIITSQPYIVNIENTTDKIIENVSLFFGNSQNKLAFNSDGNYVENGLIISSGLPNVTYNHIVKNFITNKCNIALTYIQCENEEQILEIIRVKTQSANGNLCSIDIVPVIEDLQINKNIVAIKRNYILDGDTAIVIRNVYPKTIVRMYFYPKFNLTN